MELLSIAKGFTGISLVLAAFLAIYGTFKLLGGDKGQAKRSDWYPLWYIIPYMAALTFFLIYYFNRQ